MNVGEGGRRKKNTEREIEREGGKPKRLLTIENKLRLAGGEMGGGMCKMG